MKKIQVVTSCVHRDELYELIDKIESKGFLFFHSKIKEDGTIKSVMIIQFSLLKDLELLKIYLSDNYWNFKVLKDSKYKQNITTCGDRELLLLTNNTKEIQEHISRFSTIREVLHHLDGLFEYTEKQEKILIDNFCFDVPF